MKYFTRKTIEDILNKKNLKLMTSTGKIIFPMISFYFHTERRDNNYDDNNNFKDSIITEDMLCLINILIQFK